MYQTCCHDSKGPVGSDCKSNIAWSNLISRYGCIRLQPFTTAVVRHSV